MDGDSTTNFMEITGAHEQTARTYLEFAAGDLAQACQLYFDNPNLALTSAATSSTAPQLPEINTSTSSSRSGQASARRPAGREDEGGVIHIDSDDDDVDMFDTAEYNEEQADDALVAATAARSAQEEEDAAIAKRLQEELYSENATTTDGVRAPIARTTETLVAPLMGGPGADEGDLESSVMDQLRRRQQARNRSGNPFAQSIWEDSSSPSQPPSAGRGGASSRAQRLAELFRPPYDLISHLSWDEARAEGKEEKKWLLVNLQDMTDFNCQALNRDIWKDEAVRQLVMENFIFLQYSKTDDRAFEYISFYLSGGRHENPDNYPHVAIIDPRTGEQIKVWSGIPFPSAAEFHSDLAEFLDRYSLAANSKNPVAKQRARQKAVDFGRMTEEEMLEMAMQNSLTAANGSRPRVDVHDPDELTKSTADVKGKGKDVDTAVDLGETAAAAAAAGGGGAAEPAGAQSAFAQIPSDRPHTEPANDPATTTRIQFRHPSGRVIRRFRLDDSVARIYEWLKTEPLEGKDGVEFELKAMPQVRDLIDDLDKTIAAAGLKQGTVMIEFIEG